MEATDLARRMGEFYAVATDVLKDVQEITDQQIKHWIVSPFLVALGWDPHDKHQVFLDYPVPHEGGHVDYALLDLQGKPKLVIEVHKPRAAPKTIDEPAKKARSIHAPLVLLTSGKEYSLWYIGENEPPMPLFVLQVEELTENTDSLIGLTVEYRLSPTGIAQVRKSAIRLAVLQMLEENSEKTFDAMVDWVQSQVAPGALDDTTSQAIREATMLWLTEEHLTMPAFSSAGESRRHRELRPTNPRDWEPSPTGAHGVFQYRYDNTKSLDVRQGPKEVKEALRAQGLRTPNATSFGGFYYALRDRTGLGAAAKPGSGESGATSGSSTSQAQASA
ncbi:MAG: hypothetical protein L3K09_06830 [Thermoplasmata archaeon]|nr:hypothetical protein [Thermoplasmata archaeon]